MANRQVFYSFHFDNDVMRTQQVRNIGVIEGNKPVSANEWETAGKTSGGIEKWIDDNMKYRSCVVVLVGEKTYERKWVRYEIIKGWNERKGVVGIYVHNLNCPRNGKCNQGPNPFENIVYGKDRRKLSSVVKCYNPNSYDAYNDIANNIEQWVEEAIQIRDNA